MRLYRQGLAVSWELFGFSRHFVFFVFVILFFMTHSFFTVTTLFLDHILFPKFRKVKLKTPVFIIGHPLSGTTFIHHLFTQTGDIGCLYHLAATGSEKTLGFYIPMIRSVRR